MELGRFPACKMREFGSWCFSGSWILDLGSFRSVAALLVVGILLPCLSSNAALYQNAYNGGFANSGFVPDGNATGWSDSHTLSGIGDLHMSDVSVKLNVSGGFNGDIYAYLSHNGVLVPLLNRVGVTSGNGFGYGDAGFNVTLSSLAVNDVHFYGNHSPIFSSGQLTGTWQPDGRNINPLSSPGSFDGASRLSFSSYNDLDPNGAWTLFFADMSAGGGTSQIISWELDIEAVPEPVNVALGIFAAVVGLVQMWRYRALAERFFTSKKALI
jgi:hypothetical protein